MLLGGVLTFFWRPARATISLEQHLGAGVILAALMIEVFPPMQRTHVAQEQLITSFLVGALSCTA